MRGRAPPVLPALSFPSTMSPTASGPPLPPTLPPLRGTAAAQTSTSAQPSSRGRRAAAAGAPSATRSPFPRGPAMDSTKWASAVSGARKEHSRGGSRWPVGGIRRRRCGIARHRGATVVELRVQNPTYTKRLHFCLHRSGIATTISGIPPTRWPYTERLLGVGEILQLTIPFKATARLRATTQEGHTPETVPCSGLAAAFSAPSPPEPSSSNPPPPRSPPGRPPPPLPSPPPGPYWPGDRFDPL